MNMQLNKVLPFHHCFHSAAKNSLPQKPKTLVENRVELTQPTKHPRFVTVIVGPSRIRSLSARTRKTCAADNKAFVRWDCRGGGVKKRCNDATLLDDTSRFIESLRKGIRVSHSHGLNGWCPISCR